jgi:hypothetical protein
MWMMHIIGIGRRMFFTCIVEWMDIRRRRLLRLIQRNGPGKRGVGLIRTRGIRGEYYCQNKMQTTARNVGLMLRTLLIAIVAMGVISCRYRKAQFSRCLDNLCNIAIIKTQWANDENRTTNDVPSWDDLRPYFPDRWSNSIPICQAGGSYKINRVGEQPTCSIGGPGIHCGSASNCSEMGHRTATTWRAACRPPATARTTAPPTPRLPTPRWWTRLSSRKAARRA